MKDNDPQNKRKELKMNEVTEKNQVKFDECTIVLDMNTFKLYGHNELDLSGNEYSDKSISDLCTIIEKKLDEFHEFNSGNFNLGLLNIKLPEKMKDKIDTLERVVDYWNSKTALNNSICAADNNNNIPF